MREREKQNLIKKLEGEKDTSFGKPLYLRPFEKDCKIIEEISKTTGEKKSAVAQKLIRLSLQGKQFDFKGETRVPDLLEWLVANERRKKVNADEFSERLERLEALARQSEKRLLVLEENTAFFRILLVEIFCMASVCVSYLNQIFTKIIEYFSPAEIERKNSSDFANKNILFLIEHSLAELEALSKHHEIDLAEEIPEMLYLFTKIEKIKNRLNDRPDAKNPEQNNQ